MIRDPDILALIDQLSERTGMTRTAVFRQALENELERGQNHGESEGSIFPRDRINYRNYSI